MTDVRALSLPEGYSDLLATLKERVRTARLTALRTVNTQLIELYWSIGRTVLERQQVEQWGTGVMGRLADDLRTEFPDMKGLSRRNLFYMRAFAAAWPNAIVQQAVAQLPWGHVTVLLDKAGTQQQRDWYAGKLNFYVALVDDLLRREHHNETIGILICGTKNHRSVRYSLGRSTSPMAVAAYTYDKLPAAEQRALPTEGHLVAALDWTEPEDEQHDAG
jgi:predicted nuclease of restriction endonuclease-like (RecB) superfamily